MNIKAKILCGWFNQHLRPEHYEYNTYLDTWEGRCPRCNKLVRLDDDHQWTHVDKGNKT